MTAPVLKARIEELLGAPHLTWREHSPDEFLPTGIEGLDLPRGAITDLYGPDGSGRTTVLISALAEATARQEVCALIDVSDAFDPASAAAAGTDLDRLLWVRCGGRPDKGLKAADMLVQAGGFGVIAFDLGGVAPALARRIPLPSWYRFRRAVENTPSVLLVLEEEPTAKGTASLMLEMRRSGLEWSGSPGCSLLLRKLRFEANSRKPVCRETVSFRAEALA